MEVPLFSQLLIPSICFLCVLMVRGIFAFLETSLTALRLFKLKELARTTGAYEHFFNTLEKTPHHVLITNLIASSIADVTAAALSTNMTEIIFSHFNLSSGFGFSAGIGIASIAIIIFGEIIPKNIARNGSENMLRSMLWLSNSIFYLLHPIAIVLTNVSDAIIAIFSRKKNADVHSEWVTSESEIRFLVDYIHERGLMEPEKTEMLRNVFELGSTPVREIMVPATDIVSIDVNTPLKHALTIFSKYKFTRLPAYSETKDNIIGMAHQKDIFALLSRNEEKELKDILRPIMFIPESVKINQLLREFRQQQMHIAVVLNEHGIITGLITLEDVLEEIVGEISDEHEPTTDKLINLPDGSGWLVDASVTLEELEKTFAIEFTSEGSLTLAGFLTEQLQHMPRKGDRVHYMGYDFQVQKASKKRVRQVLVTEKEHQSITHNQTSNND